MHMQGMRPRQAGTIAVVGALIALCAFGATTASAATWAGETHGKLHRANRLAAGGASWHGSFWFTTDRDGRVRGEAVVAYEPELDLTGATNAVNYIRDRISDGLGGVTGIFGAFAAPIAKAGLGSIVGFDTSFRSAEAIRRGRLTGQLRKGRLTLRWPDKVRGVPYTVRFVVTGGLGETVTSGTSALPDPFTGSARVIGRGFAVRSAESRSSKGDTSERKGSYWAAHRVG
jgi:hypothetical protein